jgi:hypothetical protein
LQDDCTPFLKLILKNFKMKNITSHTIVSIIILLLLFVNYPVFSQTDTPSQQDSLIAIGKKADFKSLMKFKDTTYKNGASGELTPGRGFQIAKNDFASLNISIYGMVRYLNQMPGTQTWEDHLGNEKEFVGRNDFHWHRSMIWFSGFIGTPKFTYVATVWSIMTTQQTLIYGNLNYAFNKKFNLGMGIVPNLCNRTMQGPFPFFTSTDRTMAEDGLRGGFTMGMFAKGQIVPKLTYFAVLGNNLSTLGVKAAKLTRDLSTSVNLTWYPTTGEFGPRGGMGDLEHHNQLATRFGASYCHSREDRFNNTGEPAPDNTQVRLSDGVLFFETGALANGLTVDKADYDFLAVDLGFKYKGFCLFTEFYYRNLSNFDADGPTPMRSINDNGYTLQVSHMITPKLNLYGINSMILDEFKRNPWEAGLGINYYPTGTRSWRINTQLTHIHKSAAGGTFGLYTSGQTGQTFTFGVDFLL